MIGTTRQNPKILAPNRLQYFLNRSNDQGVFSNWHWLWKREGLVRRSMDSIGYLPRVGFEQGRLLGQIAVGLLQMAPDALRLAEKGL
jgi:hypothetical protein